MANGPNSNATHGYVDKLNVSIREYLEALIKNLELRMNERFDAQEKALTVALHANEKRLDGMNEFRDTLRDQSKTFITQAQHEALIKQVEEKISTISKDIHKLELESATLSGKASQSSVNAGYMFTVVTLIIAIASLVLRFAGR